MSRSKQPYAGDERSLIEQWLEFQRATLAMKCEGLATEELATRACPPSTLSLARILRHMADMERFDAQMLLGKPMSGRYDTGSEEEESVSSSDQPDEIDTERGLYDWSVYDVQDDALAAWDEDCGEMREALASFESLSANLPGEYSVLTVRALLLGLTAEYARHNGHADLLREALDTKRGY